MARDQRRLAAIVSADVAGYSRLMGRDDSATLAALKAHRRELIDPKIAEYGGRIVKTTGDGLLLEFPSVVDAVRCAVDVQRGMTGRNARVPADERLEFRVGINVGDIIIDGDDIYGDGVNVAARLQTLAEPGGICASRVVRDQVQDKLSFTFEEVGAQQVKNIARPVEVYRIRDEPPVAAAIQPQPITDRGRFLSRITAGARWRWAVAGAAVLVAGITAWYVLVQPKTLSSAAGPPLMSVAVMPLRPASALADDERFAERVTQDLTSATAHAARPALVVSHGLVAKYKDKSIDPRVVGHDLNVRYLVEGDVRGENGAAVVMAQLIETTNGTQVWSVRQAAPVSAGSDRERDIVTQLANRIGSALYDAEEKRVAQLPMAGTNAMELVLRGYARWDQNPSPKGYLAARKLFEEALRHDPSSVPALLGLYDTIESELLDDPRADRERLVKELDDLSSRAARSDRDDPRVWVARADALMWQEKWDAAFEATAEALRIDPYEGTALGYRARVLQLTGRSEEALPILDQAIALDPRGPMVPVFLKWRCRAHLDFGRYDDAIATCEKALALADDWTLYLLLVAAYAQKGDMASAMAAKAELLKRQPNMSIAQYRTITTFSPQVEANILPGLRKAGIPEQ